MYLMPFMLMADFAGVWHDDLSESFAILVFYVSSTTLMFINIGFGPKNNTADA